MEKNRIYLLCNKKPFVLGMVAGMDWKEGHFIQMNTNSLKWKMAVYPKQILKELEALQVLKFLL